MVLVATPQLGCAPGTAPRRTTPGPRCTPPEQPHLTRGVCHHVGPGGRSPADSAEHGQRRLPAACPPSRRPAAGLGRCGRTARPASSRAQGVRSATRTALGLRRRRKGAAAGHSRLGSGAAGRCSRFASAHPSLGRPALHLAHLGSRRQCEHAAVLQLEHDRVLHLCVSPRTSTTSCHGSTSRRHAEGMCRFRPSLTTRRRRCSSVSPTYATPSTARRSCRGSRALTSSTGPVGG